MSSTVNKLILRGYVGKAPDTRYLPSGDAVTYFPLATHEGDHTEWHTIYAYREWSEEAAKFQVGDVVWFEGRIKSRSFKTEGYDKPRVVRELVASFLSLVSRKSGHTENAGELTPEPSTEGAGQPREEYPSSSDEAGFNVPSWV